MVGPDIHLLALLVGVLCGFANVLVDVDHIPSYFGIGSGIVAVFCIVAFSLSASAASHVLEDYYFSLF